MNSLKKEKRLVSHKIDNKVKVKHNIKRNSPLDLANI